MVKKKLGADEDPRRRRLLKSSVMYGGEPLNRVAGT